jgi:adenylate cyclase
LVNAAVIADLDDFFLRDVGLFILKGKAKPVHIFELMATQQQASERDRTLTAAFAKALALFQDHQWLPARQAFSKITEQFPNDGPSGFFLRYLENTTKLPEKSVDNQLPMIINVTTLSF